MLLDLGNLKINTKPICSKYKVSGIVEGFYTKSELSNLILENKINIDFNLFDDESTNVLVWNTNRIKSKSEVIAYVNINNKIIESKITIKPHRTDVEILNNDITGITKLKLIEDVKDVFCESNEYIVELSAISESFEAKVRNAIANNIGDIVILCDDIEHEIVNGTKQAIIPISLGDIDNRSPIVLATVIERNECIDTTDIEDKVAHLLLYEEGIKPFRKIGERIRRKRDLNYRKTHYDGESLDKKTLIGKTNLAGKVKPNRGRKELSEDDSESEEQSE